jgi:protoheme IX farnesyltransferase
VLFAIVFFWTPPHFWALAVKYKDDYSAAEVPMLPSVASMRTTGRQIIGYTLVVWALSLVFASVADMGRVYTATAVVAGAVFLWYGIVLLRRQTPKAAMRLFSYSITYLTLLFAAMAIDQLIRSGL